MSEHEVELTAEERAKIVAAYWNTTRDHIHVERVVANIVAARLADAEARAEAADQAWRYAHAKASEYVELVARIHEVYRHLVMDTEEDQALHARHIKTADKALILAREALRGDQ